jgi:hypothetical protein
MLHEHTWPNMEWPCNKNVKQTLIDITRPHKTQNTYQSIILSFIYRHVFYEVRTNTGAQDTVTYVWTRPATPPPLNVRTLFNVSLSAYNRISWHRVWPPRTICDSPSYPASLQQTSYSSQFSVTFSLPQPYSILNLNTFLSSIYCLETKVPQSMHRKKITVGIPKQVPVNCHQNGEFRPRETILRDNISQFSFHSERCYNVAKFVYKKVNITKIIRQQVSLAFH